MKTPFDINMAAARETHKEKKAANAAASVIAKNIKDDDTWDWATTQLKELNKFVSKVEVAETPFAKLAGLHEPKELKRMLGESMCIVEAGKMSTALKLPVKQLASFTAELESMHRERSRLRNTRAVE